ncbi:thiaminase II [Chondrinema litorale]|uniref:thiaminase II n=1 Tax=Chondrinema litorale TaxID=2994555 RepID=UPI002542B2CB|nr:thiaminase II [Chondrinema litorale]UZR97941.1 thiaminase II [Chondrinema litorale]
MATWYRTVRPQIEHIYQSIIEQDFIKELMAGTLDRSIFTYYIEQDALYLSEYRRTLATLGCKIDEIEYSQFFLNAASGIILVEASLHHNYLKHSKGVPSHSPTCQLYISYLSRVVNTQPLEVGIAAVLPCFTIYKEVGDYILSHQIAHDNPYLKWINTYAGEEFANSVSMAIDTANYFARKTSDRRRAQMEKVFIKASQMEWMFWDSAYNKEQWKI